MLPLDAGLGRDERRRHDGAGISPRREGALAHEARAARFVTHLEGAVRREPGEVAPKGALVVREPVHPYGSGCPGGQDGRGDRLLVPIHANVDTGHGLVPPAVGRQGFVAVALALSEHRES